eukprot:14964213-Alexandrium_andersonii.AAC.1
MPPKFAPWAGRSARSEWALEAPEECTPRQLLALVADLGGVRGKVLGPSGQSLQVGPRHVPRRPWS